MIGCFLFCREVILVKDEKKSLNNSPKKQKRKNKEKLSLREIEDLMGMHMDTFTRRNGAVRRR